MAKFHDDWTVLPHGPLHEVAPGLLTVVGQIPMPLGNFPRRMTVVGLANRRTAIFSPIALGEAEMSEIEALGAPAFLIVPNAGHRLDIRPFQKRYPKAKIVGPEGGREAIGEAASVDTSTPDLGKNADLISVAGYDDKELALLVRHDGGSSLIVNDTIAHIAHPQGPGAWLMARLFGFGPAVQVSRLVRRFYLKDKAALARQFDEWAGIEGLRRIIPSHGDIIDRPAGALRRLAASLR